MTKYRDLTTEAQMAYCDMLKHRALDAMTLAKRNLKARKAAGDEVGATRARRALSKSRREANDLIQCILLLECRRQREARAA